MEIRVAQGWLTDVPMEDEHWEQNCLFQRSVGIFCYVAFISLLLARF